MKYFVKGVVRSKITHIVLSIATVSTCAVSTASASDFYNASAPITYKAADPYAYGMPQPMMPQMAAPQMTMPQMAQPQGFASAPMFDQRMIDPNLYPHQKVGNPYTVFGQTYYPAHNPAYDQVGAASWYGDKFHGKLTANGETYDKMAMTAAHKTLPLNSYVIVTNLENGRTVKLRLNDRGPFVDNREIDLSEAAADVLGMKAQGTAKVRVQYAGPAAPQGAHQGAPMGVPAPVAPQQQVMMQPQPHMQAQPQPVMPQMDYQPLRQMPQPLAPQAAPQIAPMTAPAPQSVAELPQVNVPSIMMPAPSLPQTGSVREIPEAYSGHPQSDTETLTISGPIHMAGSRSHNNKARVIPAIYRTKN